MNTQLVIALALAGIAAAPAAFAQVTFYEREGFEGRSFTTAIDVRNFERAGFNDRASSMIVTRGNRWEVCEDARFAGRCVVLRPGNYPSLSAIGLNNSVSSVRIVSGKSRIEDQRYAPAPVVSQDYRQRRNERLYEAEVKHVRAVVGPPEQRCWIERTEVRGDQSASGIAGAVIGGILGHQVGSGQRDVQRCREVPAQGGPAYWDVTYNFKGRDHRVQMATRPGQTVRVNANGEPRA